MTQQRSRADLALEVTNFLTLLWEEIEKNEGRRAHEFFAEDGVFDSKMVTFEGRKEIQDWFLWRTGLSRIARHLLTNPHFSFTQWAARGEIEMRAIMTHFGATGTGVLPVELPIGIYDHKVRVREGGAFGWSILLLENNPVFAAPDHIAKTYSPTY